MQQKQERFLEQIYNRYYRILRAYCYRKVSKDQECFDLIEECIQDTFFKAYLEYSKICAYDNIQAWLMRTCMNSLLPRVKSMRSRRIHLAYSLDDYCKLPPLLISDQMESVANNLDAQSEIKALGHTLTEFERQVFTDRFIYGLTLAETAKNRNVSVESVKAAIIRIRKKAKRKKA